MKYIFLLVIILSGCKSRDYFSLKEFSEKGENYEWVQNLPTDSLGDYNVFYDNDNAIASYTANSGSSLVNGTIFCKGARHNRSYDLRFVSLQQIINSERIEGFPIDVKLKFWSKDMSKVVWHKP